MVNNNLNAIKSLSVNLKGMKTDAQDGNIVLNKTAMALKKYANINVAKADGSLMDTFEILTQLSEKWDSFNDQTKAGLSEAIAGKYQYNVFNAMMDNWKTALDYQERYNEGFMVGSAEKENERFINSIEGRIIKLQEEFNKLVTTTISTETVKDLLSILTEVLSVINKIVESFDKMGMSVPLMVSVFASLGKTIKALGTGSELTVTGGSIISKLIGQTQLITNATEEATNTQQGFRVALTNTGNAFNFASIKTALLTSGVTLLNTLMTGVVLAGITLVGKAIYDYANANEIAHDKIAENIEITKSAISSYQKQKSSLKEIAEEYDNLTNKNSKSTDELERYGELQKEIAEIAPDLVLGTNADGNPILALNGSLSEYIDGLDEIIERQQQLLMNQQNSLASKSRDKLKGMARSSETGIAPLTSVSFASAWDDRKDSPWVKEELKNVEDGAKKYIEIIQKRNDAIDDLNIKLGERFEEFSEIEMEQQQSVFNKLSDKYNYENYNNLGKKTKSAMETLIGNFNWGSSVVETVSGQEKFIKNFDVLSKVMKKNATQVQQWNKTLLNANQTWQLTGDIDEYKKSINGVAEEIAELTNTDAEDWIIGFANELKGGLDLDAMGLNDFLKAYGKTYSDILSDDKIAIKIRAEYDDTSNFLEEVASAGTYKETVNHLLKVNKGEVKYKNLPYQIEEMLKGSFDGGKTLKDYESRLIMKVSTEIQSSGELNDESFGLISKMLNGELSETEIKTGIELPSGQVLNEELIKKINEINKEKENNVLIGIELNEDKLNEDLNLLLEGEGNKELRLNLKTAFEDDKFETFNDLIKDMDTEQQIAIATAFVSYGDKEPDEIEDFIKSLPEEVQTIIKIKYEEEDKDKSLYNEQAIQTILVKIEDREAHNKITTLIDELNEMDIDKELKINIIENALKGTEGSTEGILNSLELIKDLPNEQKMTIITNLNEVISGIKGLDREKISEKIVEITGKDDATDDIEKVENNNPKDKNLKIEAEDNATEKINNIDKQQPKAKVIPVDVSFSDTLKNLWKILFGGGNSNTSNGTVKQGSISKFTNIANNPEMVDAGVPVALSEGTSNISENPSLMGTSNNNSSFSNKISTFTSKALRPFTGIGSSTTLDTSINISKYTLDSIKYSVNLLQELEYRIDNINDKLSLLDVKMENAVGTEKIKYLQKQNALYEEQSKLQKELYDSLTQEKQIIKKQLKNYGFTFDQQGNLRSYEETLIKMEKKAEQLEKTAKNASEKASNYDTSSSSKSKSKTKNKTKKSLESKADEAQNVSDEYKEKLEKVKDLTEEYLKIQRDEIPDAEKEWLELQNSIKANNDEIERLELEDKLYKFKNSVTDLTNQYDIWSDKIDLIDTKLNNSLETEKVTLMTEKLNALNKQFEIQEKMLNSLKEQLPVYQNALSKYNVKFDANGNISNMEDVLNQYQNSEDLEKINDLIEEYDDLIRETIPNAEKEYAELDNAIKDVYDSQLDTVKDIEDKITDVIKDQLDKRKELIQKQYDAEIDLLNKRKDEYNKNKDTDDYYESLEEAQKEINDIQKKITIATLDDSINGRNKLSDLMEDLKEAQDKYNDLVNDRTDNLINNMYDDEIDRLQQESENKIQDLEDEWNDSKIAELVAKALGEGTFTDIDGEVHNLQDTLLNFAEESGEALGVLGDTIKNELVLNLQDALNYIKEYDNIINSLGLSQLGNINYSDKLKTSSLSVEDISINVYGTEGMNEEKLAKEVSKQLENKLSEITNGGLL